MLNQSGIAAWTRWRTISGYRIRTVNISNRSKDRLRMAKELAHFFYRNIRGCVRYLLRQIAYRYNWLYAPRHEDDSTEQRIYGEMHAADGWWDVQAEHPSPTCFKRP